MTYYLVLQGYTMGKIMQKSPDETGSLNFCAAIRKRSGAGFPSLKEEKKEKLITTSGGG